MSTADRDGKIAQLLADMLACLAMEINESVRDSATEFEAVLSEIARAECRACRIQACEIEGNTAELHTCVLPPGVGRP